MESIEDILTRTSLGQRAFDFLKRTNVRNADISLYLLLVIFVNRLLDDEVWHRAQAVAFSFTLAIFPTILFIFSLVPYLPVEGFDHMMFEFLQEVLPTYFVVFLRQPIQDIVEIPRSGLLSFGFLFAAYMATSGMRTLMDAFNGCCAQEDRRGLLSQFWVAQLLTLQLLACLVISVVMLMWGREQLSSLDAANGGIHAYAYLLVVLLRFVVIAFLFFTSISFIYYMAPARHTRFRLVSVGSLIATGMSLLFSWGFTYYLESFNTYNRFYGSIGALIALMVWIFAVSLALLVGFQLNSAIDAAKEQQRLLLQEQYA